MYLNPKYYVIAGIITTVIAQISLKRAGSIEPFKINWLVLIFMSVFFYFISFISYYYALKNYDISTVQPIMMASIITLIALYGYFAGEGFNYFKIFGVILSIFSIYLISK